MVEESLRVRRFEDVPTSEEFASRVECKNVPAVFSGCIKNWKAFSLWSPSNGGLNYLLERVGSSTVEAMLSRHAPVFYGDIRSHERVPLPFSAFIENCKEQAQNLARKDGVSSDLERNTQENSYTNQGSMLSEDALQQVYLAQVAIMNFENKDRVQLGILGEDIERPTFLGVKELASVNLWMNSAQTRSSTHYDPHHNLLCVVSGCKQVVLWPPSASPFLYPMPLYGEASNHSAVALNNPDHSIHPRAERLMEYSQKVILQAGDALFIPEGWFHQVDSDDLTIAVNFWWQSNLMSDMLEHMDAYYVRILLRRLTDKHMNQVLNKRSGGEKAKLEQQSVEQFINGQAENFEEDCGGKDLKENMIKEKVLLHELEPKTLKAVHELVSLVHDHVNFAGPSELVGSTSTNNSGDGGRDSPKSNLFSLEDDPVASILWTLHPHTLQNVFLAMVHNFPRTLEALILHLLSPVGAEVLTRKFDEMDQLTSEEDRSKFYQVFYSAFDDQYAAMDAILGGKESFAHQAFKNVLNQYLGVSFDGPKSSV
ncbi:tRNAPhe (7-(3-amino-3-carboxypropyl)wyosine37-C2)-hydroxylase [Bertholletia excelsa]